LTGRLSPGAGGAAGIGCGGASNIGSGIGAGAGADGTGSAWNCSGWKGSGGMTGAGRGGGGGVYAGTDIGVCDGMNGRAAGVGTRAAGADGVGIDGHDVWGVGRSGGSVALRGGVIGLSRGGVRMGAGLGGVAILSTIGAVIGVCRPIASAIPTGITPLQAEHRARTPPGGTFAGSTRYVVEHCGQLTFITHLQRHRECSDAGCRVPAAAHPFAGQS
jgi:hypothetical protein